jgi:hypothetical protein
MAAWRTHCTTQLEQLTRRLDAEPALASAVEAQRASLRNTLAGERPIGPSACWSPAIMYQATAGSSTVATRAGNPAEPAFDKPFAVDPQAAPKQGCALAADAPLDPAAPWAKPPSMEEELGGTWPRDHRYGPRDAESGVRVSMSVVADGSLDARPAVGTTLHTALARCLGPSPEATPELTTALVAELAVGATGKSRVTSVKALTDEATASAPASQELVTCVRKALAGLAFTCLHGDKKAKATATICLRHE